MPTFDLLVAINGSTVWSAAQGGDDEPWTTRVSRLRITGGGGGFYRTAQPWTCSFDLDIPPQLAHMPRTVTVAVRGPRSGILPDWATGSGGVAYRVVFHGNVVTAEQDILGSPIRFNAVDEMATLFSRRARLAASANTGPRAVLAAIASAHSLTIGGNTAFPNTATGGGYQIDAPAQRDTPNGDYIRTALAGTGINCHAEWDGPIATPTLRWRPDWFWDDPAIDWARLESVRVPKMWQLSYPQLGYAFDDYMAYVNVDGTDAAGTRRWGRARIHDATQRLSLGHREAQLTSWLDSTTQCRLAAKHLLSRVGYVTQLQLQRLEVNVDHFAGPGLSGVSDATHREKQAWAMATLMLGDLITFESAALWPGTFQDPAPYVTDDVEDVLANIRAPTLGEPGWSTVTTGGDYSIRYLSREWDPSTGWTLELGLHPDHPTGYTIDNADTDSGTY